MAERMPLMGSRQAIGATAVSSTRVSLEQFGQTVTLKDSCYKRTNFLIRQSRTYFPKSWLFTYWYFSSLRWWIALFLLADFLTFFSLYLALALDVVNALLLIIFMQHQLVNCHSVRIIKEQPVVPSEKHLNNHYLLKVEELTGVYLEAYQSGMGTVMLAGGQVKIQVLTPYGMKCINRARRMSVSFLLLVLLMAGMSGTATWLNFNKRAMSDQFAIFRS